jgi:diaminopimelate decarboxylase
MIVHPPGGTTVLPARVSARLVPDVRLDEAIAIRRCALYRRAFQGSAVSYPATLLRLDAVANWFRCEGVTVDVTSGEEFDRAISARIAASQIVVHSGHGIALPSAVHVGVGRFVVSTIGQVAVLRANSGDRTVRLVVDATNRCPDALAAEALAHRRLGLIGLHYRVGHTDLAALATTVDELFAQMVRISRAHAVILSRLSLGDVDLADFADPPALRRAAELIDGVVEDGCARFRYPRPALTLSVRA